MSRFRSISLWFLRLVCLTALSGMVYLAMLSTTVLDRTDVKQWLSESGLYANNTLVSSIFTPQPTNDQIGDIAATAVEQNLISSDALTSAAARTFTAPYLKFSFDHVVDQSYDWIEGQGTKFTFSVPVQTKRDQFIAELVKEVEPRIAALPPCTIQSRSLCRPDVPTTEFARQVVVDSISQSYFLQTPITEASFSAATSTDETQTLSRLPQLRSLFTTLQWIFPIIFILSLGAVWLLALKDSKLQNFIKLSRGAFSSMLLATVLSAAIIIIERFVGLPLESIMPPVGELSPIFAAFVTKLILGMAWSLLLFAGIALVLSIICWIVLMQIKKTFTISPTCFVVAATIVTNLTFAVAMNTQLAFLSGSSLTAAPKLLGCILERQLGDTTLRVRIVETEAYDQTDVASHSFKGKTQRTSVMFGEPGHLYVYFTYGMHYCGNVVTGPKGHGAGVLIRAVEPLSGEEVMQELRGHKTGIDVTNGPAKTCQALSIDKALNGHYLSDSPLILKPGTLAPDESIVQTTRIGISKGIDLPWRFYIKDNPYVSRT